MPNETELRKALSDALKKRLPFVPKVALVLGSGLGSFADELTDKQTIAYSDLPHMPQSSVAGHQGQFVIGKSSGVPCVAMQGRVHMYEGYSEHEVVRGLVAMLSSGASVVIVTNAAGGANAALNPGDLMVIEDHLNLTGKNALCGPNDNAIGPRFLDMTVAYDAGLRSLAHEVASRSRISLRSGVYAGLLGPTYETPAEIRMLQRLGADAVGMSTVQETIVARHRGAKVLGISCITNKGAGLSKELLSHSEVEDVAKGARESFCELLRGVIAGCADA